MFMLVFYVPIDKAEKVKEAVFAAGGGKLGNYDSCCWQTVGQGQFRPLAGSDPYLGETGRIEKVKELRVEMICVGAKLKAVRQALIVAHPYETPAYGYWEINQS